MGVSLAKEPYVEEGRPSLDARARMVALLLHLDAKETPEGVADSARLAAPALLALGRLTVADLPSVAPLPPRVAPGSGMRKMKDTVPHLIGLLQSSAPCPSWKLCDAVIAVVDPLRREMFQIQQRRWGQRELAITFADRIWEAKDPQGPALMVRHLVDLLSIVMALVTVRLATLIHGSDASKTIDADTRAFLPSGRRSAQSLAGSFASVADASLCGELKKTLLAMRQRVQESGGPVPEADKLEDSLETLAGRIEDLALHGVPLDQQMRFNVSDAMNLLIRNMREVTTVVDDRSILRLVPFTVCLDDATQTRLREALRGLRTHVEAYPQDADEATRIEKHVDELSDRIAEAVLRDVTLGEAAIAGIVSAIGLIIADIESICSRPARQAAQDLENQIRFTISAHGDGTAALALPAERLVA